MHRKRISHESSEGLHPKRMHSWPAPNGHICTDQPGNNPGTKLSLDKLPEEILDSIIEHLGQRELLRFCLVSKAFLWPNLKRLYRKITMAHDAYFEEPEIPFQHLNYFTLMRLGSRGGFLATVIQNEKLAALIRSLTLTVKQGDETFPFISQYFTMLLSHLRLESFHFADSIDIPWQLIETVQTMTCHLPWETSFPPNLVELKIHYDGCHVESSLFEELAWATIRHGAFHKLKKLAFGTLDYAHQFSSLWYDNVGAHGRPYWVDFFNILAQEGIKLNLTFLRLDGEFWDNAEDKSACIVGQAVQLNNLVSLDIAHSHYVLDQPRQPHEDGVHMFLDQITKNTPSLQHLAISHTQGLDQYEIDALARVLRENLPNQLESLRINFDDQDKSEVDGLRSTILNHQRNLVKIELEHNPFLHRHQDRKFTGIPAISAYEADVINEKFSLDALSPRNFDYEFRKPFVEEDYWTAITSHKREILDFLLADLIYSGAAESLPLLTTYLVCGLYINMKDPSVFVNGKSMSLKE
ncbi:hypothetical protein JCM33374_g3110 [Metschnikowia sp. JCM 33374]|nr:hypothetical protein JCM33374_g3110 [Metschnikowia sp. JCM 33374]